MSHTKHHAIHMGHMMSHMGHHIIDRKTWLQYPSIEKHGYSIPVSKNMVTVSQYRKTWLQWIVPYTTPAYLIGQ